ncbi:hypothetical protein AtEden1_Chr2g0270311 [Arabidopsis thaliana]
MLYENAFQNCISPMYYIMKIFQLKKKKKKKKKLAYLGCRLYHISNRCNNSLNRVLQITFVFFTKSIRYWYNAKSNLYSNQMTRHHLGVYLSTVESYKKQTSVS